jgi:hypothetical protein
MPRAAGAPPAALPFKTAKNRSNPLQFVRTKRGQGYLRGRRVPARPGRAGPFCSAAEATASAPANAPEDGNYRVSEDAAAGEGLAAAEHCGAARCNCCKVHLRSRQHAASGLGPSIPD